ncbi:hypothetical protein AVEN_87860-1 [Araneus ventricosus]|uniref:Uncharacterized protein n=1 Tax=Araneus ventricosus TaxID=182803 RepID=A0A4Y2BE05_ARAVE|nr:hypothetical protein AVEN_87860-1 [Araneus ventricosus]
MRDDFGVSSAVRAGKPINPVKLIPLKVFWKCYFYTFNGDDAHGDGDGRDAHDGGGHDVHDGGGHGVRDGALLLLSVYGDGDVHDGGDHGGRGGDDGRGARDGDVLLLRSVYGDGGVHDDDHGAHGDGGHDVHDGGGRGDHGGDHDDV